MIIKKYKLRNALKYFIKICQFFPPNVNTRNNQYLIIIIENSEYDCGDIKAAIKFYVPSHPGGEEKYSRRVPWMKLMSGELILINKKCGGFSRKLLNLFENVFFISKDYHIAAWEWIRLSNQYYNHKADLINSKLSLKQAIAVDLNSKSYHCSYIFGTGPSLAKAIDHSFNDGFKIVCNTIVKDQELFNKLQPNFIVAGDALYHFSYSEFACAFRRDLLIRLKESTTCFVYPDIFDVLVQREFGEVRSQLIPISIGVHKQIEVNLLEDFSLPSLGNVLLLLQLPLACTLSKRIYLWGFDGKSPDDNINPFWANSDKHAYPELMHTLKTDFPGFFQYHVPNNNSDKYISSVHGDILEACFRVAESKGYTFEMLHPSWTKTLNARYLGDLSTEEYFLKKMREE